MYVCLSHHRSAAAAAAAAAAPAPAPQFLLCIYLVKERYCTYLQRSGLAGPMRLRLRLRLWLQLAVAVRGCGCGCGCAGQGRVEYNQTKVGGICMYIGRCTVNVCIHKIHTYHSTQLNSTSLEKPDQVECCCYLITQN